MQISKLVDFFIGQHRFNDDYEIKRARIFVRACILTSLFSNTYIWLSVFFGYEKGIYTMVINVVSFLILSFFARTKLPIAWLGNIYLLIGASSVFYLTYYSGGVWSAIYIWIISIPVLALLVVNKLSGIVWTVISFMVMVFFALNAVGGVEFPAEYNHEMRTLWYATIVPGVLLIVAFISFVFENMQSNALKESLSKNAQLEIQKETILNQSTTLEDYLEEKDNVIQILAHDLRGPLKNIESLVDLMKNDGNVSSNAEYLGMLKRSSQNAQNLVDKVLQLDASEYKKLKVNFDEVDLVNALADVVKSFYEATTNKSIKIVSSIDHESIIVKTDVVYLKMIFENLLSNAIKFSEPNTTINTIISTNKEQVEIRIIDQGPGINPEEEHLLFNKFQKLSARPTSDESSTGLGLSLVKRYAELIKGKVWHDGNVDLGACFVVELPVRAKNYIIEDLI